MITADIKNGFNHVLVHPSTRDFLGFRWRNQYFRWRVLPHGLSLSPYFFRMRPIITYLRHLGLRITCYVDDYLLLMHEDQIVEHRKLFLDTLKSLNVFVNFEKSSLDAERKKVYLGYIISTEN